MDRSSGTNVDVCEDMKQVIDDQDSEGNRVQRAQDVSWRTRSSRSAGKVRTGRGARARPPPSSNADKAAPRRRGARASAATGRTSTPTRW